VKFDLWFPWIFFASREWHWPPYCGVTWSSLLVSPHVYEIVHVFSENVKTTRCSTERGRLTLTARMRVRPEPCVEKCRYQSIIWKYVLWCVLFTEMRSNYSSDEMYSASVLNYLLCDFASLPEFSELRLSLSGCNSSRTSERISIKFIVTFKNFR
jgi:hypothetical protein